MPMTRYEIEAEIRRHPRWHYQFDLGGVLTPIHREEWINRHRQRKHYFFDPLAKAGAFAGKRVLDLGCNAGFWSLEAVRAGCEQVVGIDAREAHIEQASLVFRANEVPERKYRFLQDNVFDGDIASWGGPFDVVLCLGLLYHVCKPMELLERISGVNRDLLVIDSTVLNDERNLIELRHEPLEDPRMSADYQLVFLPTPRAVHDMAAATGYTCRRLVPSFDNWEGCEDFRIGDRYAFVCTKQSTLAGVFDNVAA